MTVSTQVQESLFDGNKSDPTTAPSKNMGESHKHNAEQKMSDTKEHFWIMPFLQSSKTGRTDQGY